MWLSRYHLYHHLRPILVCTQSATKLQYHWDQTCIRSGVEVFVFHWGCRSLGALGNDQRSSTIFAREGTEPVLPLQDIFFGNTRTYLFIAMRCFVPSGMISTRHAGSLQAIKYCIFSNPLNALSPAKTVECPRKLTKDSISIYVMLSSR